MLMRLCDITGRGVMGWDGMGLRMNTKQLFLSVSL